VAHMVREITRGSLEPVLEELSYPALRPDAAAELREVTLVLDDGEVNLGATISETGLDAYQAPEDLLDAIEDVLPDVRPT